MRNYLLFAFVALVVTLGLNSCASKESKEEDKYHIAVTIAPTKTLLEQMLDTATLANIKTKVLLPNGAIPESYEPTIETVAFLEQCDAWYYVGDLGFESKWIDVVKQINPGIKLIRLDVGLQHIVANEHRHGEKGDHIADPHYWFSLQGMECMTDNLAKALNEVFPGKAKPEALKRKIALYRANLSSRASSADSIKSPNLIVYHPSLTYLVQELGIKQFVIEDAGKEPSPQYLADLSKLWQIDSQEPNKTLSEVGSVRALGSNPRLVVLKEYRDITLALSRTYGLPLLMKDDNTPYILDLFAEDLWEQLGYFYGAPSQE